MCRDAVGVRRMEAGEVSKGNRIRDAGRRIVVSLWRLITSAIRTQTRAAARIPRMASRLIGIPSRVAFFVCGLISVSLSRMYLALRGLDPVSQGSWSLFSVALMVVGGFAVFMALLPGSWVQRACKIELGKPSLVPIKMLVGFAVVSYLVVVGLSFAPHSWQPSPQFVFSVCPACALTVTVDPSLGTVLLGLAPLSAAVYGSLGAVLGYLSVVLPARIVVAKSRHS